MDDRTEQAVRRVIDAMRQNLGERITIDDMARIAMFSKFHFCRVFRESTGMSPVRFFYALRLAEAKQLLVGTSLSIADIGTRVGYASTGTFSSRFKSTVGVPPSVYRATGGDAVRAADALRRRARTGHTTIRGAVSCRDAWHGGPVFVGLFREAVPTGLPARCSILPAPGAFALTHVMPGRWHVLAYSPAPGPDGAAEDALVGAAGPLMIRHGTAVRTAEVRLRPLSPYDPPVLLALTAPDAARELTS
ncbi:helix-turn-helix domain-containing protein [Actinomadura sp. NPDC049382]|uniref:helix-turn-helix domain-containing protein n=1 Tax=Actinomadura TaxID=1988 RepID=UPI00343CC14D